MFVLDTNILSEMMKPAPEAPVARWVSEQSDEDLFTTSICKAEILVGLAFLPSGHRRRTLETAAREVFDVDMAGRVLAFDAATASLYAEIAAGRRGRGRSIDLADLLIAAIARAHNATVVTRDVGGFEFTGVPILNPWDPT